MNCNCTSQITHCSLLHMFREELGIDEIFCQYSWGVISHSAAIFHLHSCSDYLFHSHIWYLSLGEFGDQQGSGAEVSVHSADVWDISVHHFHVLSHHVLSFLQGHRLGGNAFLYPIQYNAMLHDIYCELMI